MANINEKVISLTHISNEKNDLEMTERLGRMRFHLQIFPPLVNKLLDFALKLLLWNKLYILTVTVKEL